jgi:MFS family permease
VIPLVLAGVGVSMAIPAAQASVVGSVSLEHIGKAAGANSMMRELGGVFGIAVIVAVFAAAGSYASPTEFGDGFRAAVTTSAGLSLAGALVALGLPGRRPAGASPTSGRTVEEGRAA